MARIPQQVARRGLEVVQPPNYPVLDATARAAQGFGATVEAVAQRWQEQKDRFNSLHGVSRLSTGLSAAATEALAAAPPDGTGYLAGMQQREQEAFDSFLQTVPAHLRPEFEQRLEGMRAENADAWAATEAARTRDYQRGVLAERTDNARVGLLENGPGRLAAYQAEVEEFVTASILPPEEKAERMAASRQALQRQAAASEARIRAADDALSQAFVATERTAANGNYDLVEEGVRLAVSGNLSPAWYRRNEADLPPVLRNGFSRLVASPEGDGHRDPMVASALLERVLASPADAQGTALVALSDGLVDPADFTRVARLAGANVTEAGRAAMDGLMGLRPPQLSPGADRDDFARAVAGFSDWLVNNPQADDEVIARRAAAATASIAGGRRARGRVTVPVPAFTTTATAQTYAQQDQARALRATLTAALLGGMPDERAGREAAKLRAWHDIVGISMPDARDARDG